MILPELPYEAWKDTYATLHMWMQIVGKVRLELSPHVNHWWEVPFYLSARGLTTSPIPYSGGAFDVEFDFINHMLMIRTSGGAIFTIPLMPRSVADFYMVFMAALKSLGIDVSIYPVPVEIPDPIPFLENTKQGAYDADYVHRFWRVLLWADGVFKQFRGRFIGKHSPVHFFWGASTLPRHASAGGSRRSANGRRNWRKSCAMPIHTR